MNVMVSSSNTPMAHPPRSNPFLRSSSDAPPFPCITPSTVTCVMVVSFMGLPFLSCCGKTKRREACYLRPIVERLSLHGKEGVSGSSPSEGLTSPWSCRPAPAGVRLAAESGARVGTDAGDQRMWPWQEGLFDD